MKYDQDRMAYEQNRMIHEQKQIVKGWKNCGVLMAVLAGMLVIMA